jgi:hypothetical protein
MSMTKSSSTFRRILISAAVFFICVLPANALAAIRITAVEYDPAGADAGREWIKITNTGPDAVLLSDYRLFEGGVNHKLSAAGGASALDAGAVAIIATDPAQYLADHPSYEGVVFKSSFSLSNTGETIVLKDAKLTTVDTYSYTAPPVVKAPAPPKAAKTPKTSATKNKATTYVGDTQAAAVELSNTPSLPVLPNVWTYGLGLAALLTVGAGAALYARPPRPMTETFLGPDEFNIE